MDRRGRDRLEARPLATAPAMAPSVEWSAFLADHLIHDFDGVFRQVVRMRIEWNVREGKSLFPETVDLWNRVR